MTTPPYKPFIFIELDHPIREQCDHNLPVLRMRHKNNRLVAEQLYLIAFIQRLLHPDLQRSFFAQR